MIFKNRINNIQERIFDILIFISYFLLFCSAFGFSYLAPKFLDTIDYYIRIYICLFLLWRFNPLKNENTFTNLDRKIAFRAGLLILTTTTLNEYFIKIQEKIQENISLKPFFNFSYMFDYV